MAAPSADAPPIQPAPWSSRITRPLLEDAHCASVRGLVTVIIIAATLASVAPSAAQDPAPAVHPSAQPGALPNHGTLNLLPWEHIDTYSANAVLTFTDLTLPGNAGFDFAIRRTLNTNGGGGIISLGFPAFVNDNRSGRLPVVSESDGTEHPTFRLSDGTYMTAQYWRYTPSSGRLELPNGVVCTYGLAATNGNRPLSIVEDPFANHLLINYRQDGRIDTVVQNLGGEQSRTVAFG